MSDKSLRQKIESLEKDLKCIKCNTSNNIVPEHNELDGLQGGEADKYYHLTEQEHTDLFKEVSATQKGIVNNTSLQELGGVDKLVNGVRIGHGNSNDSDSTVFGSSALNSTTTGINNSAFGTESLKATTTGRFNAGFGDYTLWSNTTGQWNTAIGSSCMPWSTSGSFNTAIASGLYWNKTGNNNTAIGVAAGYANETGSDNTYLGRGAAYDNGVGNYNVALGRLSMAITGGGFTSGGSTINMNNNVFIGSNVRGTNGMNDTLAIDNKGATTTSAVNALIYGGFSLANRFVNIGGRFSITPTNMPNADGDALYTKYLVYKTDGTVGTLSGTNLPTLYNSDGTLSSARTVTMGTNALAFNSSQTNGSSFSIIANSNTLTALNIGASVGRAITVNSSIGLYSNTTGIDFTGADTKNLQIISGTTGSLILDTGTTGQVRIGTNTNAKTVTIGNITGVSNTIINTGTGGVSINTPSTTVNGVTLTNSTAGATAHVRYALRNNLGVGANITVNSGTATTDANALLLETAGSSGNIILRTSSGGTEFRLTGVNTYILNSLLSTTALPSQTSTQKGRAIGVDTTGTLRRITNEAGQVKANYTGLTLTNFAAEATQTFNINGATISALSASPTTTFPFSTPNTYVGIFDGTRGTTPVVGRLIENPIAGQAHTWRIQGTYTNKAAGNNGALDIIFRNPISGFTVVRSMTLPSGRTSGSFDELIISIADSASIPAPNGYVLEARTSFTDANMIVGITSITKVSNAVDN